MHREASSKLHFIYFGYSQSVSVSVLSKPRQLVGPRPTSAVEREKKILCWMFCFWRNQLVSSYWGVELDVRHVLCVLTCYSGRVCLRVPTALTCQIGKPHDLSCFLNKLCRMHRNILEHCQSHVCLVDPASLAPWLADLTLPDRPVDWLPLIAKGLSLLEYNRRERKKIIHNDIHTYVCIGLFESIAFHFSVISISPLKAKTNVNTFSVQCFPICERPLFFGRFPGFAYLSFW